MLHLMIENDNECSIEELTILGLSTSRDDEEKCGLFGTGFLHGCNTCLRHNINPVIFVGDKKLSFFTQPKQIKSIDYQLVCFEFDGQVKDTGFCLDFSSKDWDCLEFGIREFITNSLDAGGENIEVVSEDNICGVPSKTRIFLPLLPEVQKYYNEINQNFLHFTGRNKEKLLPNKENRPARIYRKGVFVRQIENEKNSLFDYNFGDELDIDECRNLNDYQAAYSAAKLVSAEEVGIRAIFSQLVAQKDCWETYFPYGHLTSTDLHQKIWREEFGNLSITDSTIVAEVVRKKGHQVCILPYGWYSELKDTDIPNAIKLCGVVRAKGYELREPNEETKKTFETCWKWLAMSRLTEQKTRPGLMNFYGKMEAGSELMGEYSEGVVYINVEYGGSHQTMLEELSHHLSGAKDFSRDLQDFAFNLAAKLGHQLNKESLVKIEV